MNLQIGDQTVKGVSLVRLHACHAGHTHHPGYRAALAEDGLVLEGRGGEQYYAYKKGLYTVDHVFAKRGSVVKVDGTAFRHVHNVDRIDTLRERVFVFFARIFVAAGDAAARVAGGVNTFVTAGW